MLPPDCIPVEALLAAAPAPETQSLFWEVVRAALGVKRLAKQDIVDQVWKMPSLTDLKCHY